VVLGPLLRKRLEGSPGLTRWLTNTYRGFFIDLHLLVNHLPLTTPTARLLNIGTGDGVLVSIIARRYPQLNVTTTDITPNQGWLIDEDLRDRIRLQVHTPDEIASHGFGETYDMVLLADVIHHVPVPDRSQLMARAWQATSPGGTLLVKDIEDRGFKARLSLWSDRYLTGDRHTQLICAHAMELLMRESEPTARVMRTALRQTNYPNYMLVGSRIATDFKGR